MIIITGAAGFIGSNLVKKLNSIGQKDLLLIDDINSTIKKTNVENLIYNEIIGINIFWDWIEKNKNKVKDISTIFHLGACSDTLETDLNYLHQNNVVYSQKLWAFAIKAKCKFIYASSAATYGDGSLGFSDDINLLNKLQPLNPYGISKNNFDLWAVSQDQCPKSWYGLKYFNVFGPGESHKGRMSSVIWHFINKIKKGENLKLFESSHGYDSGNQMRDFIYIKDAIMMTLHFFTNSVKSGIYNIGTGQAEPFNKLGSILIEKFPDCEVEYIKFPAELKKTYQAYTCADIGKLRSSGYNESVLSLKDAINDYLENEKVK